MASVQGTHLSSSTVRSSTGAPPPPWSQLLTIHRVSGRYSDDAFLILNCVKILCISYQLQATIVVLQDELHPEEPQILPKADMLFSVRCYGLGRFGRGRWVIGGRPV